jgi:hypothetical protein
MRHKPWLPDARGKMPLKPTIIYDVAADAPSMRKAIGPKLAKQFAPNPQVPRYALVLKFPDGVVTGRAVSHAQQKSQLHVA